MQLLKFGLRRSAFHRVQMRSTLGFERLRKQGAPPALGWNREGNWFNDIHFQRGYGPWIDNPQQPVLRLDPHTTLSWEKGKPFSKFHITPRVLATAGVESVGFLGCNVKKRIGSSGGEGGLELDAVE